MPWKATCYTDERMQFIVRVLAGEDEMTVLCREYGSAERPATSGSAGISRKAPRVWRSARTRRCNMARRMMWRWCKRCWDCASAGAIGSEEAAGEAERAASGDGSSGGEHIGDWLRREGLVKRLPG